MTIVGPLDLPSSRGIPLAYGSIPRGRREATTVRPKRQGRDGRRCGLGRLNVRQRELEIGRVVDGPGGAQAFVVATEDNHVTTYDATMGAVIWDVGPTTIGPYATKNPPGGTIESNHIGITGTPFIDIASRTIFFDAMVTPDNNVTYHHTVFALSIDTGAVKTNWPVDVGATLTGFNSNAQNQRGALQFLNGVVYVPYGGYDGDGGTYNGSVIGFPLSSPKTPTWWHTTAAKGGIWGLSNVLAIEGRKYNIRVWTLAPGALTRMTSDLPRYKENPGAALGPDGIAPGVLYMVSELSGDQTGRVLGVSGQRGVREMRMMEKPGWKPPHTGWKAQDIVEHANEIFFSEEEIRMGARRF